MVSNINLPNSFSYSINADSKKTQAELDAIANKGDMTHQELMKEFDDELVGYKKEGLDFRNLTAKDRENMTLEELIELKNRMNDLGTLSR
jgi:t-SNARE complex subunit (syntaxin)